MGEYLKPVTWISSSLEDLKTFPKQVQAEIGFTLYQVQEGKTPANVKPLSNIYSGMLEIVSNHNKNTY